MLFVYLGRDDSRQVSLAQEMSEAEKHIYSSSGNGISTVNNASSSFKHHNCVPVSSEGNYNANSNRPIFILKFSNGMPMGMGRINF